MILVAVAAMASGFTSVARVCILTVGTAPTIAAFTVCAAALLLQQFAILIEILEMLLLLLLSSAVVIACCS